MSAFGDFVKNDWWIAIPMFLMSFTGIALLIWRIILNINGNTNLNVFFPPFAAKLEKEGINGALRLCRARSDIIPKRLFVPGLETYKQGLAAQRRAMANSIELEILPDLNFLLPSILAIAKIATMVGLFGTVVSMIGTFTEIQRAKGGNVADQAGGIGLALFATALGLITAIPMAFSHVLLKAWVARFEVRMKSAAHKLMILMQNVQPTAKGSAAGGADGASANVKAAAETPARK
jgi:biopolymer transport protein ExbB